MTAGEEGRALPRAILARVRDLPRHYRALRHNLETISLEEYARAAAGPSELQLNRLVYPIERPFEILDNYVVELARLVLEAAGLGTGDASFNLRRLAEEGVISDARRRRLAEIHRVRNQAQHDYPDARARVVYEAAGQLVDEVLGFLEDTFRWLLGHGYREGV